MTKIMLCGTRRSVSKTTKLLYAAILVWPEIHRTEVLHVIQQYYISLLTCHSFILYWSMQIVSVKS